MATALASMMSLASEALEAVKSAIIVVDAQADDLPIIYMNPAFGTLTGYSEQEVLGRNCRFLQGPETDRSTVRRIRQALDAERSVHAILHNYRKDGSLFLNEIFINPIRDADGRLTHFVGCQNAVDAPGTAVVQSEARERIATLSRRERQVFDGLVCGATVKEIAKSLGLSPRTVEKYRYRMQEKMSTNSLTMLVRYAIALGTEFEDCGPANRLQKVP